MTSPLLDRPGAAAIRPPLSSTTSRFSIVPSRRVSVRTTSSPTILSPCGVSSTTLPRGADLAALAVPDDLVGGEIIAVARHPHRAAGGDDVGFAVIGDLVGAEFDHRQRSDRRRWRSCGGRCGSACASDGRRAPSGKGSAVHQANSSRNAVRPAFADHVASTAPIALAWPARQSAPACRLCQRGVRTLKDRVEPRPSASRIAQS